MSDPSVIAYWIITAASLLFLLGFTVLSSAASTNDMDSIDVYNFLTCSDSLAAVSATAQETQPCLPQRDDIGEALEVGAAKAMSAGREEMANDYNSGGEKDPGNSAMAGHEGVLFYYGIEEDSSP